jgi:hypothetical protein
MWSPEIEVALRWLAIAGALLVFSLGLILGKFVL